MATQFSIRRSALAVLVLAGLLGGCASGPEFLGGTSRKVTFNNVSESSLNVTFFVKAYPEMQDNQTQEMFDENAFVSDRMFQLDRGQTAKYSVAPSAMRNSGSDAVVHVKIQPVSPSWEPAATEYWLELLTNPPVSIVATGTAGDLVFNTGSGAIAVIPGNEINSGRFEHRVVGVTEDTQE